MLVSAQTKFDLCDFSNHLQTLCVAFFFFCMPFCHSWLVERFQESRAHHYQQRIVYYLRWKTILDGRQPEIDFEWKTTIFGEDSIP